MVKGKQNKLEAEEKSHNFEEKKSTLGQFEDFVSYINSWKAKQEVSNGKEATLSFRPFWMRGHTHLALSRSHSHLTFNCERKKRG